MLTIKFSYVFLNYIPNYSWLQDSFCLLLVQIVHGKNVLWMGRQEKWNVQTSDRMTWQTKEWKWAIGTLHWLKITFLEPATFGMQKHFVAPKEAIKIILKFLYCSFGPHFPYTPFYANNPMLLANWIMLLFLRWTKLQSASKCYSPTCLQSLLSSVFLICFMLWPQQPLCVCMLFWHMVADANS